VPRNSRPLAIDILIGAAAGAAATWAMDAVCAQSWSATEGAFDLADLVG
jgi:hypothetical protein